MTDARKGFLRLTLAFVVCLGLTATGQAEKGAGKRAKLEHLLRAAMHLEEAGQVDLAAQVYALVAIEAEASRQRLLHGRLEQSGRIDGEAAQPQVLPSKEKQIFVQAKLIEFSWTKLRESGMSLVSLRHLFESDGTSAIVDEDGRISEFIELLCTDGLAQVLSQPKLTTISGQSATVEIGQDPATVPAGARRGVHFECTPRIIDQGKLSLDIDFRIEIAAEENARTRDRGDALGGDRSFNVKTQVELRSGDTLILAGPRQAAGADARSVLVLLTASSERIFDESHAP